MSLGTMSRSGDVAMAVSPAWDNSPSSGNGALPVSQNGTYPLYAPNVMNGPAGHQGNESTLLLHRLLASESRISPNRNSVSWLPEVPEPDVPAPVCELRTSSYAPLPQDLEALTLKRRFEAAGLFGVGLQVSDDPPHVVQRVSRLIDKERRNISDKVAIGDTLYSVNNFQVEMLSIDTVEQLIFGDLGTLVRLTFCDKHRQRYEVVATRHVPISVWEQERVWYELKPQMQGKELRCDPSIINILEAIRAEIGRGGEVPSDLLKDFHKIHAQTTLGFRIGVKSLDGRLMSCVVQQVIPGSAADQGSGLQPGDLIVAVNGVHISNWDENKLLEAFRGEDIIGTKCRLTIERPEAKHLGPVDVEVLRTNASFAKEVEVLFLLGQEHAALLQAQASYEVLNTSLQHMMHQAVALERHRILHEQVLAERLHLLQVQVLESVTEAERRIKPADDAPRILSPDLQQPQGHRVQELETEVQRLKAQLAEATAKLQKKGDEIMRLENDLKDNEALKGAEVQLVAKASQKVQRAAPAPARVPPPLQFLDPVEMLPPSGKYDKPISITLKSNTPDATIYYTTNGTQPTESNFEKSGPAPLMVELMQSTTIKAMCAANGLFSQVNESGFVIEKGSAGVGLLLEKERNGDTVVKKIISGGAAEEDGRVQLGDLVTHVNDIAVTPLPLDQVLEIIKGTEGTKVKMDVLNHDGKSVIELVRKKVSHVVGIISTARITKPKETTKKSVRAMLD